VKRAIFISYRRDDSEGEAGRLYDDLVRTYGDSSVFMDVAGIDPGSDFRKAIDDNVATCGVFLAVIGPHWATMANDAGKRRLDDANDFVRLEVASALAKNIAVIPVLVHEARMPGPDQMPDAIKDLAYRNSVELTHARWNSDVQLLIKALQRYVTTNAATEAEPVHATVPVQLPPPVPAEPASSSSASKLPLILGGAIVVLVALIAVLVFALTHRNEHRPPHPETTAAMNAAQPATQPDASASQANVLTGNWRNTKNVTGQDALLGLKIDGSGPAYNVVPVAKCAQGECQWDLRTITLSSGQASGQWKLANTQQEIKTGRTVTVTMRPDGQYLAVDVKNEYPNDSAEPEKDFHYRFAKQ
jgi:TIR domain